MCFVPTFFFLVEYSQGCGVVRLRNYVVKGSAFRDNAGYI